MQQMNAPQLFDLGAPDFSGRLEVRPVARVTADHWFAEYHYSGTSGGAAVFYGAFQPDLMAVVGIGQPTNESGVAAKYELGAWRGNLEINRVAVHPSSPKNTASRCVAAVLGRLVASQGYSWVFSYADTGQNHHGGIYQALNAVYVGVSQGSGGYVVDGVTVHPRTFISMFGTRAKDALPRLATESGRTIEYVDDLNTDKHTYILPIDPDKRVRQAIRDHLRPYTKPYPKRAVAASSDAPDYQSGEGGSQPTLPLQLWIFDQ